MMKKKEKNLLLYAGLGISAAALILAAVNTYFNYRDRYCPNYGGLRQYPNRRW